MMNNCLTFVTLALVGPFVSGLAAADAPQATRQLDAYRAIGEAHYENGDFKLAASEFRRCLALAPESPEDSFNLALALTRAMDYDEALQLLEQAEAIEPGLLNVHYLRGIIYKRQGKFVKATECLKRVLAVDKNCWGTCYNLGVCYKSQRRQEEAQAAFEAAAKIDANHPSAIYQLIILARQSGDVEAAKRHAEKFELVKATIDESEKTPEALERSQYTEVMRRSRRSEQLGSPSALSIRFTETTDRSGLASPATAVRMVTLPERLVGADFRETDVRDRFVPTVGGAVTMDDYDGDGDLDIYFVRAAVDRDASANRLFCNQGGGRFSDVTAGAGVGDQRMGLDAVFGDFDNDGHNDLYVVNYGPNTLYRNRGDQSFEDVSTQARADEPQFGRQAVFFDYDHDNDLDLLVVNDVDLVEPPGSDAFDMPDDCFGQVNALLRNNGNRTFTDQTDEAGLLVDCSQSHSVVFADFDGDYDVDVFVANADAPSLFFANARLGKFKERAKLHPPIDREAIAADAADIDRDGDSDLLVVVRGALFLYKNDGAGRFDGTAITLPTGLRDAGVGAVHVFDYDNNGWLDLLLVDAKGKAICLLEGTCSGEFGDATAAVGLQGDWGWISDLATGDLDGDGDQDIVLSTRDRGLRMLRNDASRQQHWIGIDLVGKKVNRSGYGASVEIARGGHYQRRTVRGGRLHFGLADLPEVDVVRVTWPNGVAQNVIRPSINDVQTIEERVRVSASCAMLWAYNGVRFEFINEVLGVGALGVPIRPGEYHKPDCTELTKIEARQLAARDGVYELRITEELREITYADQFALRVIDHPRGIEIIPNEMFTRPPFPEDKFYAVGGHRPPRSAVDNFGQNVTKLVQVRDGRWPTFPVARYQGLAHPHTVTLDFGDLSKAKQITLYLDGWIHWPESSTVAAISQDPEVSLQSLQLEVRDAAGQWQTAVDSVGLPTSKGAVVPVDLTGRFLVDDYHVRLSTNLCLYFDRIFISTRDRAKQCRVSELPVSRADLQYRGFSSMTRDRYGFERFDYEDASRFGPWSPPSGLFTRYGLVTSLLAHADDRFVVFAPGDELTLQFQADDLPELPGGWERDFIFYADGWVKDGDLNTALSQNVEPLPFHGMSDYPYSDGEHNPRTAELDAYQRTYNTRRASSTVGLLRTRQSDELR